MGRSSLAGACMRQWQQVYSVWTVLNEAELAEADFEADADGLSSAAASVAEADAAADADDEAEAVGVAADASESSVVSDSIALPSMKRFLCRAICSISWRWRSWKVK